MGRPTASLETALGQLMTETRIGHEKAAAKAARVSVPAPAPIASELRKVAALLRSAPEPGVTYEDLNRVKEALYGR
jgi:hypothetical protein